jgi:hypothetical protein
VLMLSTRARTLRHGRADSSPPVGMGHLGLRRLRRRRSFSRQGGQRSPGPTNLLPQPWQKPWAWPVWKAPVLPTVQPGQGEQEWPGDVLRVGADADDAGADVGWGADNRGVVDQGAGSGDAAAVG